MKITKQEIENLDLKTVLMCAHWLYDSNRRNGLADTIGRQTKAKTEYNRAMAACRKHCLDRILDLAEYIAGRRQCAETIDLITCPTCDNCAWPITQNCGDEYTNLCGQCAGVYLTGDRAADYINQKNKEVKQ